MRHGSAIKSKMGVWACLERLAAEQNPRLVALIEIKDARHLLEVRAALREMATGTVGRTKIASAKRLLDHQ